MKLIQHPRSPFWCANLHVGWSEDGKKKYALTSSKVRIDPSNVSETGTRLDRLRATEVLTALQNTANEAMKRSREQALVTRREFEGMVESVLRACGLSVAPPAPSWGAFSSEVLRRHCRDLSPATTRSYWAKKAGFDGWLEKHERLSVNSLVTDFHLSDIQGFYDSWIEEGGQSTTANGMLQGVALVFQEAVVAGHIRVNPCDGVKRRDNVQIPRQPFTLADITAISRALVEHAQEIEHSNEWALAIKFAIFTGAREGDCVNLRWSDFSENFRRVRFVPRKKERLHALGKVDASVNLLLPEFVAAEFSRAFDSFGGEWVCPNLRGITAGRHGLGARFRAIMDLAGIAYTIRAPKGDKGISQASHSFHSFRHALKTQFRAMGVSMETSNYVTGHDDEKVARRYVHEQAEVIYRECQPVFAEFQKAIGG